MNIAYQRLLNQHLARPGFEQPSNAVAWLGAVQSQDYPGAKWALGQRLRNATDETIERAFTEGSILRTHVMRPTWHFVTPADIRWMVKLTASRVNARMAPYHRKYELDQKVFSRSNSALEKALRGGKQLTRNQLRVALERAGVPTADPVRAHHIMMRAELDGLVCSGARTGKQFTYALLEERVVPARALERDEALAELAKRYFQSHGPATVRDFVWWSGLTTADARSGLEMVKSQFTSEVIDNHCYWFSPQDTKQALNSPAVYLLSNYDEYVSYHDRVAIFDKSQVKRLIFSHFILSKGRIKGTWRRAFNRDHVMVESKRIDQLTRTEERGLTEAVRLYGNFLGINAVLK
jgi:DNA glycosylase AlkZ-like